MPYKIDGKFVSREKYEAHEREKQVSEFENSEVVAEIAVAEKPERAVKPLVAATRRLTKADARLVKAKAAYARVQDVSDELELAEAERAEAAAAVSDLLAQ